MKKYDVIVIGSGCGLLIAEAASSSGQKTALVEKQYMGGTCLNTGCIPSKMLIHPADVVYEIEQSKKLGISADITEVDYTSIMDRTNRTISGYRNKLHRQLHRMNNVDLYESSAKFISNNTIDIDGQKIFSDTIFIASGTRPLIPAGFEEGDESITSDNLLKVKLLPKDLLIIGGGYIACEYAHFYASMGSNVTIIEMADRLLTAEEPEVSALVEKTLEKVASIHTKKRVDSVNKKGDKWFVSTKDLGTGERTEFSGSHVLYAIGRISNADLLNLESTDIELDRYGYIKVNPYLETSVKGVFAIGDINGQFQFRHAANYEAEMAWHNANIGNTPGHKRIAVDYSAMPGAVFTRPQVASVGMTEHVARRTHQIKVGKIEYFETAKGEAMQQREGFAKAIIDKGTEEILGFHIAGPHAPILIQEVINAMALGGTAASIHSGIHIHPALSEIIPAALSNAE